MASGGSGRRDWRSSWRSSSSLVAVVGTGLLRQSLARRPRARSSSTASAATVERRPRRAAASRRSTPTRPTTCSARRASSPRRTASSRWTSAATSRPGGCRSWSERAGVATDKVVRTLGWRAVAEQELGLLAPTTRAYLSAYADGVNDYLGRAHAGAASDWLEYAVLARQAPGYTVEKWTRASTRSPGSRRWAGTSSANYERRARPGPGSGTVMSAGARAAPCIYPDYAVTATPPILRAGRWTPARRRPAARCRRALACRQPGQLPRRADAAWRRVDPAVGARRVRPCSPACSRPSTRCPPSSAAASGIGSNSWVVVRGAHDDRQAAAGQRPAPGSVDAGRSGTRSGLHCRTVSAACPFDVAGFAFAGLPGIVIGHNDRIAWGFTNLGAGRLRLLPREGHRRHVPARRQAGAADDADRRRSRSPAATDVTLTVRSTVHGPIVSDVIDSVAAVGAQGAGPAHVPQQDTYAVSLAWTALDPGNDRRRDLRPRHGHATSPSFRAAAAKLFEVPAQNLVYADTDGHIGYQAPGLDPDPRDVGAQHGAGLLAGAGLGQRLRLEGVRRPSTGCRTSTTRPRGTSSRPTTR